MGLQPTREDSAALGIAAISNERPYDKEFTAVKAKARRVLDGSASFSKRETDLILARLMVEGYGG